MVFNPARTTGELLTEARISQKRRQSRQGQSIAQTKRPRQVRVEKSTISEDTSSSESDSDENSQEMDDNSDSKWARQSLSEDSVIHRTISAHLACHSLSCLYFSPFLRKFISLISQLASVL